MRAKTTGSACSISLGGQSFEVKDGVITLPDVVDPLERTRIVEQLRAHGFELIDGVDEPEPEKGGKKGKGKGDDEGADKK